MAAWVAPVVGGAVSLAGGIIGGNRASNAAAAQAEKQNEATIRQYEYDIKKWDLDKEMIKSNRNHAFEEIAAKAVNDGRTADYRDAAAAQQYNYSLQIRNREQQSNEDQFARSEEIYMTQMGLNAQSAETAREN